MKQYENQSSSVIKQLPTNTTSVDGEEEMRTSVVDTSGFGMYSSGTGTGAITGGGIAHDQYITTPTAVQSQLPCFPVGYSCSEDDGMGGRRRKGTKEEIEGKIVPAFPAAGMTTSADGNGQQGDKHHEKKGLMERIKEKLPGHHHHHHHHH